MPVNKDLKSTCKERDTIYLSNCININNLLEQQKIVINGNKSAIVSVWFIVQTYIILMFNARYSNFLVQQQKTVHKTYFVLFSIYHNIFPYYDDSELISKLKKYRDWKKAIYKIFGTNYK